MKQRIKLLVCFALVFSFLSPVLAGDELQPPRDWRFADGTPVPPEAEFVPPRPTNSPKLSSPEAPLGEQYSAAIEVVVGLDGGSAAVKVIRHEAPDSFVNAAIKAAEEMRFEPARFNGQAVAVRYVLAYVHRHE